MGGMTAGIVTIGAINSTVAPSAAFAQSKVTVTNVAGGTQLFAANAARKYLLVQNPDTNVNPIYLRVDGGVPLADASAIKLEPGQTYEPAVVPTGAIVALSGVAAQDVQAAQG